MKNQKMITAPSALAVQPQATPQPAPKSTAVHSNVLFVLLTIGTKHQKEAGCFGVLDVLPAGCGRCQHLPADAMHTQQYHSLSV
jgi:hypothetical protein